MAWSFGDGFDLYAASTNAILGYWDSGVADATIVPGRFTGSRGFLITNSGVPQFVKSSGANDAVHHVCAALFMNNAITGTSLGNYIQLRDGATAQCSIVFRSDGAILLTSGIHTGTVLATYPGAITASTTWVQFEIEVVINNTTGSFTVRKNGNPTADFTASGLNTRGGTANNYANTIGLGQSAAQNQQIDDFFWRSDTSAVAWIGDIRCITRMPASDAAVQFSRSTGATNFSCVDEAQQNALTDYVFSSTPGQADFYGIATIASTPSQVFAVTTRALMQKSDAGTRTAAVQLKSGATTVASSTVTLSSSGWLWAWRTDTVDPATSAAWTAAGVNNAQIGPVCIA
jgi:hypothetical protein